MAEPLTKQPPQLSADPSKYIAKGARISADGKYRYQLWREWRGTHDPKHWRWLGGVDGVGEPLGEPLSCLFVMLNPSTADGEADDPTIRRCVGFAKRWKFERLEVVNLFAYRATKPSDLFAFQAQGGDPIGWQNSELIGEALRDSGLVVCAWGANAAGLRILPFETCPGMARREKALRARLHQSRRATPSSTCAAGFGVLVPMPD